MTMISRTASAQRTIDVVWSLVLMTGLFTVTTAMPEMALAGNNPLQTMFSCIYGALNGTTGKLIATVAVITVGIGALLGKISWGMAMIVGIGCALVFGASTIVNLLGNTNAAVVSKAC